MDALSQRLLEVCHPDLDTACFHKAVEQWHEENAYNGERVPYLQMTTAQRCWIARRAQELKTNG